MKFQDFIHQIKTSGELTESPSIFFTELAITILGYAKQNCKNQRDKLYLSRQRDDLLYIRDKLAK